MSVFRQQSIFGFQFGKNFAVLLVLWLKGCKQVGPVPLGALERHLTPPAGNVCMMAGQQHLGHRLTAPFGGVGILRIFQQAIPVAFFLKSRFVGQDAGHHTAHRIGNRHGRDLAAGEDKIPDGNLLIDAGIDKPLVDAFIVSADQDEMFPGQQFAGLGLGERCSLRESITV